MLKSQFIRGVDNILQGMGTFLATVCANPDQAISQGANYLRQLPQKAIDQITQQFVPTLLSTLGVVIEPDGRVALSEQSYQEVLKRLAHWEKEILAVPPDIKNEETIKHVEILDYLDNRECHIRNPRIHSHYLPMLYP
ncbi:hypothetical protein Ppb6_04272 [Photorhabdus australis subsp. thailandensis]|uniref:Uncharacterized protein n=2 Tax=Photorhabdus australis TaxID=286156 RepID=A0A1C0TXV1_9GAMM|nr:hypothetical protein [Photorhabdus australis]OCQ50497.1 hypothetical protein Ppb6_04272 [Photorhabdus australis subsp. thailandensis]